MDIQQLTQFFMWCTLLNLGIFVLGVLASANAGNFIFTMHEKWFSVSRDEIHSTIYKILGIYKILILVFAVIPWIALSIIG